MQDLSIVIVAGGLGKRLYTESLEFPKPLFTYNNKPIIAHLIDLYKQISKNIIIVVGPNNKDKLLVSWINDYYKNNNFTFIEQKELNGTNEAVNLSYKFIKNKCLISWCDFILDDSFIDIIKNIKSDTFFTSNVDCRFGLYNNVVTKEQSNPGFIGLYYFNDKPNINLKNQDFIENFINKSVNTQFINCVNLGTIKEISELNAFKSDSNRYFNNIKFDDNIVIKSAITEPAKILAIKELNWYKNIPNDLIKYVPKFEYKDSNLILEKINGKPITQCTLDSNFWRKKLPEMLKSLHQGEYKTDINSCINTYVTKPFQRLNEVKNIIDEWFKDSKIINGIDFSHWSFPSMPCDLIPKHFTFIHGDLQFSNTLLDNNGNIKIIDPRGYFGDTLLFGDPAYDIAKLLYAIDNYHKINEKQFSIHKLNDGSTMLVHESMYIDHDIEYFIKWCLDNYEISKEKLNFILFTIWLSLTSYIINDPAAIIASYSKAMIRSKRFLI